MIRSNANIDDLIDAEIRKGDAKAFRESNPYYAIQQKQAMVNRQRPVNKPVSSQPVTENKNISTTELFSYGNSNTISNADFSREANKFNAELNAALYNSMAYPNQPTKTNFVHILNHNDDNNRYNLLSGFFALRYKYNSEALKIAMSTLIDQITDVLYNNLSDVDTADYILQLIKDSEVTAEDVKAAAELAKQAEQDNMSSEELDDYDNNMDSIIDNMFTDGIDQYSDIPSVDDQKN